VVKFKLISLILLIVLASTLVSAFDRTIILPTNYYNSSYQNISNYNSTYWNLSGVDLTNTNTGKVILTDGLEMVNGLLNMGRVTNPTSYLDIYGKITGIDLLYFIGLNNDQITIDNDANINTDGFIHSDNYMETNSFINATGNIYGADIYSNGVKLENFNSTDYLTQQYTDGNTTIITNPIFYYKEGFSTGELKINLPHTLTNAWVTIELELEGKEQASLGKVIFSSQATSTGWNISTTNIDLFVTADTPFGATTGFDTIGFSTNSLGIGAGNSFFSPSSIENLKLRITKVTIVGTNTSLNWVDGWTMNWINAPFTSPTHQYYHYIKYWNSNNDGTGSYLDADSVDGYHARSFFKSNAISQYTNYNDQANSPGMWKGTNINDSAYFPNLDSGNRSNIFLIGDILANGQYTHQMECKAFKDECSIRASGSAVGVREWLGLVTDTYLYNTNFTGNHTQIGDIYTTGNIGMGATTLLTTPKAGTIEYDGNKFYITNRAKRKAIDRTSDVLLETVTVANTITETTLWTGEMEENSLDAGNIFKFHADGLVSNGGSASPADQITLRVNVGGNTIITLTPATKALDDTHWHLNADATQRTIGVSGSRAVHVDLEIDGVIANLIDIATIDTTNNMNITLTAEWGSAKVANTISIYQGYMEYKN